MKRFWLVLLALGMLFAYSSSVFAADVKFTGSYYAAGMYLDKTSLVDDDGRSTAFYYQRLRVNMEFIASPYLKLVTRFDAMERAWGAARAATMVARGGSDPLSSGTTTENENIAFDLMYVQYVSKIGIFRVGYQDDGAWGTVFADTTQPLGKITYMLMKGPVTAGAYLGKFAENSTTMKKAAGQADADFNMYAAFVNYTFKADKVAGTTGLLWKGYFNNATRPTAFDGKQTFHVLIPYAKAKFGPVAAEAEIVYMFGTYLDPDSGAAETKISTWAAYLDVLADFGMFYAGATGAWLQGDRAGGKIKGHLITGGADWNPCLIMFNYDLYYWAGVLPGNGLTRMPGLNGSIIGGTTNDAGMYNALFGQIKGGVRPISDLDIMMSVSYAQADKKVVVPALYGVNSSLATYDGDYGWEIDVTATYKITNNLSYMLGGGYLFTGDYFKGGAAGIGNVQDNFLVINKLTLTF